MPKIGIPKKTAGRAQRRVSSAHADWPSYLIVFKLREKHISLRRLSRLNGYAPGSASAALYVRWPRMERLIAHAIGVPPKTIWPSRYHPDGTPSGRGERGRYRTKNSTGTPFVNVEKAEAI